MNEKVAEELAEIRGDLVRLREERALMDCDFLKRSNINSRIHERRLDFQEALAEIKF